MSFAFECIICHEPLTLRGSDVLACANAHEFMCVDGVWRCLLPAREEALAQFMQEYETVRLAEGRGSAESTYYRALPYEDLTNTMPEAWAIRAKSFDALQAEVLGRVPAQAKIVDLGAGNGWLAGRLAGLGYMVAAVDLMTSQMDGLGCYRHYEHAFTPIQAEFDTLPFAADQADLVIFNASLHYAEYYERTLASALRVLRPNGLLVVLDSPIYHDGSSGQQMVREREAYFEQQYGFRSDALDSEHYLTFARLAELEKSLGIGWTYHVPNYGWRWRLKPYLAQLRRNREPAQFILLVGKRKF